jgi:hypothetical protein
MANGKSENSDHLVDSLMIDHPSDRLPNVEVSDHRAVCLNIAAKSLMDVI